MGKRTGNIRRNRGERRYFDRRQDDERRQGAVRKTKLLVTGDRWWDDISLVVEVLQQYPTGTVLVHGACRGADIICAAVAEALGFELRPYPAEWDKYPKGAAGPIRNQQMLDEEHLPEEPIDFCHAFHNNIDDSRGTRDMLNRVQKAGIPWKLHTSRPRSSVELERLRAKEEVAGSSPAEGTQLQLTEAERTEREQRTYLDTFQRVVEDLKRTP